MIYSNPLAVTSQFYFCGLPLRLDSYRGCAFQCNFCFARYRGGNTPEARILPADSGVLARRLHRALTEPRRVPSFVEQFLIRRTPIHFGGMSDPFQPAELKYEVTKRYLEALIPYHYPVVISTRGVLVCEEPYLSILKAIGPVIVQFSLVTTDEPTAKKFEPHSSTPSQILKAMERLSSEGLITTCRWQPYIPRVSEAPGPFMKRLAGAGARHVALEHLKLPFERKHVLWAKLKAAAGNDLLAYYRALGAKPDGREWVLPPEIKVQTHLAAREEAHSQGLSYGAADNDLQYLSDTDCCCSGVDQFEGFEGWFRHQIGYAVRKCKGGDITYASIADEWTPTGSIDRWLNSKSRIGAWNEGGGGVRSHIQYRWNNPNQPLSPKQYYGVQVTDRFSQDGFRMYRFREPTHL